MSLVELSVERGADAVDALPKGIRESKEAVANRLCDTSRKMSDEEFSVQERYV
jgi:type I restriction enzyme R subunit